MITRISLELVLRGPHTTALCNVVAADGLDGKSQLTELGMHGVWEGLLTIISTDVPTDLFSYKKITVTFSKISSVEFV